MLARLRGLIAASSLKGRGLFRDSRASPGAQRVPTATRRARRRARGHDDREQARGVCADPPDIGGGRGDGERGHKMCGVRETESPMASAVAPPLARQASRASSASPSPSGARRRASGAHKFPALSEPKPCPTSGRIFSVPSYMNASQALPRAANYAVAQEICSSLRACGPSRSMTWQSAAALRAALRADCRSGKTAAAPKRHTLSRQNWPEVRGDRDVAQGEPVARTHGVAGGTVLHISFGVIQRDPDTPSRMPPGCIVSAIDKQGREAPSALHAGGPGLAQTRRPPECSALSSAGALLGGGIPSRPCAPTHRWRSLGGT